MRLALSLVMARSRSNAFWNAPRDDLPIRALLEARGIDRRAQDFLDRRGGKVDARVKLWTRHGADFTDRLPRIAEAVRVRPETKEGKSR